MNAKGQATLEFVLLMILGVLLASLLVGKISDEGQSRFGNLAHVLSYKLSTGVCEKNCFFSGYKNRNVQN